MTTGTWVYPVGQPQQMQYQRESTFVASHPQLPPQSPAMAVHISTMNRADAPSPQNVSSGNHSPAHSTFTTFHEPCPSDVLNSGHPSTYTGRSGGLPPSIPSSSSFHEPGSAATTVSENHSPHNSPFIRSNGVMTSLPHEHYDSPYVERPADVQLLHCPQCTQRFASQEHFACVSPLEPPEAYPTHIPTCSFRYKLH